MATFLTTSGTNHFLEELIKRAQQRLILISPYLRFSDRFKELIQDKSDIDITIVYGKKKTLHTSVRTWVDSVPFITLRYCHNVHAKCYLSEHAAIITSMNLYEFSQVNNNEMSVVLTRSKEEKAYNDAVQEAERLIRISRALTEEDDSSSPPLQQPETNDDGKLSTSKLAKAHQMTKPDMIALLVQRGLLEIRDDKPFLTDAGKEAGGEFRFSTRSGPFFLWPAGLMPR